jgi:hypothetical protein
MRLGALLNLWNRISVLRMRFLIAVVQHGKTRIELEGKNVTSYLN